MYQYEEPRIKEEIRGSKQKSDISQASNQKEGPRTKKEKETLEQESEALNFTSHDLILHQKINASQTLTLVSFNYLNDNGSRCIIVQITRNMFEGPDGQAKYEVLRQVIDHQTEIDVKRQDGKV